MSEGPPVRFPIGVVDPDEYWLQRFLSALPAPDELTEPGAARYSFFSGIDEHLTHHLRQVLNTFGGSNIFLAFCLKYAEGQIRRELIDELLNVLAERDAKPRNIDEAVDRYLWRITYLRRIPTHPAELGDDLDGLIPTLAWRGRV